MENYVIGICPFCKKAFNDGETVRSCPECGKVHHEACWIKNNGCTTVGCKENSSFQAINFATSFCGNCGEPIKNGQAFCPKCGEACKISSVNNGDNLGTGDNIGTYVNQSISYVQPKKKGKLLVTFIIIAAIFVLLATAAILFFVLKEPTVDEINLSKDAIELKIDETEVVTYTISPKDANDDSVEWSTSDDSIAEVDEDGEITAIGAGTCKITITIGDASANLTVTVKESINFEEMFLAYCSSDWAECAEDGSYLSIDTNPDDLEEDDFDYSDIKAALAAIDAIEIVNKELGLPSALYEEMGQTNSLDGRQTREFEDIGISVTWKYHPDNGLEVIYSIMN